MIATSAPSKAAAARWLKRSNPQLHLLVVLALATAARAGELLKLTWEHVELDEGRVILRHTKNGGPRAP